MIAMVAIGVEHPGGPVKATAETNLVTGFTAALNIILSYGKTPHSLPVSDISV